MPNINKLEINEGVIINIGANIGLFAIHLAKVFPSKKIIAIEPNPEAYSLLVKNIPVNNCSGSITAINVCVSDVSGKLSFSIIPGKSEYSSISGIVHKSVEQEIQKIIEVESKQLKEIVLDKKVSLIFMDVEGAEKKIIDGSIDILLKDKPIIVCECNNELLKKFDSTSLELVSILEKLNYNVTNADKPSKKVKHPYNGNILAIAKSNNIFKK